MVKVKELQSIRQLLVNRLLTRLALPLIIIIIGGIFLEGYLIERDFIKKQKDVAESISRIVDNHLDHSERIIDIIGKVSESSEVSNLPVIMESTIESFEYFDAIYFLDENKKITIMTPNNPRYKGLDLSNIPDFKNNNVGASFSFSHPFISIRTGDPTVYIVRYLSKGGCIVGELNLRLFQREITNISKGSGKDFVFIMDQTGTVLAHPSSELVKQQVNLRNLGIFQRVLAGKNCGIYNYNGGMVVGSAVRSEITGWVVVNQVSLNAHGVYLAWTLGLTLLASSIICAILVWSLRKWLQKYITEPLESLSGVTTALTSGDFQKADILSSVSTTFAELNKLSLDFQLMSNKLQIREAALLESEKRYHNLFDRIPIGLFKISVSGEILEANQMFVSMFGYSNPEELLKVNICNLMNKSLDISLPNLPNESLINYEAELRRHDGTIIMVEINAHTIYESDKKELYYEGSIKDITKRKQIENKIKEHQEYLLEAEKAQCEILEKALIMKDEFISLISHELKTPLNVIYSALQLIESVYIKQIPDRVKGLIGNIKQNTFRQLRLVNNLLDVTRINSGQYKLNLKNIDIVYITEIIAESVEVYAIQKNINISFKSDIKSKTISIDEEKYERILLNIISNAIKFTENGGDIIVAIEEEQESDSVKIKVADTGIGIPEDKKEIIFERFGQVDSNLSRRAEGVGIGLSLVKLLVNALGGSINVESEIGSGSTFTIILPAREISTSDGEDEMLDVEDRLVTDLKIQFSDIYF